MKKIMEGPRMTTTKAEIDTSAPFRSVKEAVILFGERVLATELYANKLKEDERSSDGDADNNMVSELEETKQSLEKAKEESIHMAKCLSCLQQELEQTKRELHHLKFKSNLLDLKFVEDDSTSQVKTTTHVSHRSKKYVTFANPPSTVGMPRPAMVPPPPATTAGDPVFQRHPSLRKKKKKPLLPFNIGGIFSWKKGSTSRDQVSFA